MNMIENRPQSLMKEHISPDDDGNLFTNVKHIPVGNENAESYHCRIKCAKLIKTSIAICLHRLMVFFKYLDSKQGKIYMSFCLSDLNIRALLTNLKAQHKQQQGIAVSLEDVFLYGCPDCPSYPAHLNSIGWAIWAMWALTQLSLASWLESGEILLYKVKINKYIELLAANV